MKRRNLWIAIPVLAAIAVHAANTNPKANNAAAFARLKSLVGEWEAETAMGKAELTYELIAGGTALVEKDKMEKMPVMLTVYHLDGDRLILTHYCAAGNQPRMLARAYNPESGQLEFQFLDATNLAASGGHMHNAKFHFVDKDHFASAWDFFENGRLSKTETFRYTRVK